MNARINSFINIPQGAQKIQIFAYANKGLPGLEINGAGKYSRNIKEKIIYLSKIRGIKIPMKRYVVCVEMNEISDQVGKNIKWLELPILLIYLHLTENLNIHKLDDCLCAGWICASGRIFQPRFSASVKNLIEREFTKDNEVKYISIEGIESLFCIDTSVLMQNIANFKYQLDQMDNSSAMPIKSFIA